ncbi:MULTISPECIES: helix-turn-helix transcriptional regulator [Gilliamella]|uniref:YafY family transcriptional regulator n=1 Tax=Gilliamella apicola TaxID=1196095 RepID=A0A556SCJ2_9GAMM|nr:MULTISPECIES: YafY family protein [Gilliamella]TSJ98844.1 YafY family transcriptional regulator [Gilliamella apicola]
MKINRIITIIMILLQKDRISAKVLSEKLDVSLRTIYRDIQVIERAGIPIITYAGSQGGISILKDYKISKGLFTKDDVTVLLKGLNLLSSPILSDNEKSLTQEKIKSFLTQQELNDLGNELNQLAVDLSPWFLKQNNNNKIAIIKVALSQQLLLSFDYVKIKHDTISRLIEPYQLLFKEKEWYLQAFCLNRNDFRLFKLSKMSNVRKTDINFTKRSIPDMVSLFKRDMKTKVFKIKLLIDSSILERILDYCDEKDINPFDDNKYLVDFDFIEDDYSYGILMSFGHQCLCLEPEHVRHKLIQRTEKLRRLYNEEEI